MQHSRLDKTFCFTFVIFARETRNCITVTICHQCRETINRQPLKQGYWGILLLNTTLHKQNKKWSISRRHSRSSNDTIECNTFYHYLQDKWMVPLGKRTGNNTKYGPMKLQLWKQEDQGHYSVFCPHQIPSVVLVQVWTCVRVYVYCFNFQWLIVSFTIILDLKRPVLISRYTFLYKF